MSADIKGEELNGGKKRLQVTVVQMDANPAPTEDRLQRAEGLVAGAVKAGTQLVVLPECFNTGYSFSEQSHKRVESLDGPTVTWLREAASRFNIHLAGSLMLLEQGEVYSTLLLFAPDGRMWRYDKNYPWGYERAFFRPSKREPNITIAETDLGSIGMLVCWDVAHLDLWRAYANRVDLMIIASCPVDAGHATYHFQDSDQFTASELGSRGLELADSVTLAFGEMMNQQIAWLGVPAIHAIEYGDIRTELPLSRRALTLFSLISLHLLKHLPKANKMEMACETVQECKIVNGRGEILNRLNQEDGESFTTAQVSLAPVRQPPKSPQPPSLVPGMSYLLVDYLLPTAVKPIYRRGQRLWKSGE